MYNVIVFLKHFGATAVRYDKSSITLFIIV